MDQYAHIKGILKNKHNHDYTGYVKTVYVDTNTDLLNFGNNHRVLVKIGVAKRHKEDNYIKKIGRELAKQNVGQVLYRLKTLELVPANEHAPEHFLITLTLNQKQSGPPKHLLLKSIPGNPNVYLLSAY